MTDNTICPFDQFPAEIRDMIYEYFVPAHPLRVHHLPRPRSNAEAEQQARDCTIEITRAVESPGPRRWPIPDFLVHNHQIYQELGAILHRRIQLNVVLGTRNIGEALFGGTGDLPRRDGFLDNVMSFDKIVLSLQMSEKGPWPFNRRLPVQLPAFFEVWSRHQPASRIRCLIVDLHNVQEWAYDDLVSEDDEPDDDVDEAGLAAFEHSVLQRVSHLQHTMQVLDDWLAVLPANVRLGLSLRTAKCLYDSVGGDKFNDFYWRHKARHEQGNGSGTLMAGEDDEEWQDEAKNFEGAEVRSEGS